MTSLADQRPPAEEGGRTVVTGVRGHPVSMHKFSIKRLRPTVHKYQKVLQIDLDRLQKHKNNIDRFITAEDWVGLHQEQINASRTVQQVKATLAELERTRSQVFDNEVQQFDRLVQEVKVQAVMAVEMYLNADPPDAQLQTDNGNVSERDIDSRMFTSLPSNLATFAPQRSFHHVVPDNSRAAASKEQLLQDMRDLSELVQLFASKVELEKQEEEADSPEDSSIQTEDSIAEGTKPESKISSYRMAVFPVVGALIGGAMAGPVGLYAGIKIGGLAGAVGGGVAGLAGGTIMKSQNKKCIAKDMHRLGEDEEGSSPPPHSASAPELSSAKPPADTGRDQEDSDDDQELSFFDQIFSWGQPRRGHSESEG